MPGAARIAYTQRLCLPATNCVVGHVKRDGEEAVVPSNVVFYAGVLQLWRVNA